MSSTRLKTILYLSVFIILILPSVYAQNQIKFPDELTSSNVYVRVVRNNIVTLQNKSASELWQFNSQSRKVLSHFSFGEDLEKHVYNARFKDNGESYAKAKKVYNENNITDRLCKIKSYYFNDSNYIYALVIGTEVKPAPLGKPAEDITLGSFSVLLVIEGDKVKEYLGIMPIPSEKGYWIMETDFYKEGNDYFFTVAQEHIKSEKNYFIGKWNKYSGQLTFTDFVKLELPDFNTKKGVGYGLLNFIYKQNRLVFYSNTTIYDLHNLTSNNLVISSPPNENHSGYRSGDIFNIGFSVCDFFVNGNETKLIVRRENNFYIERFKSNMLEEEIPLGNYTVKDLYRFPFYSTNGEIVITPKETDDIILLTY